MHNLWTRVVEFTDQKKSEMMQATQIKLSINSNTTRFQI